MSLLHLAIVRSTELVAAVKVNPDPGGLPGGEAAQKLINGGAAFALMACVATVLIGAAQWGLGSRTSNFAQADDGKTRVLKGVAGAFLVGTAAAVVNFFFNAGTGVQP